MHGRFSDLSQVQKKYAVVLAKYRPDRDTSGEITSTFVRQLHHELLALRSAGGPIIGWPRWVFVDNLVRKSVGFVPFPSIEEIDSFENGEVTVEKTLLPAENRVQLKLEPLLSGSEYFDELKKAGILKP